LSTKSVSCKTCALSSSVNFFNKQTGEFAVSLKWGQNMLSSGSIFETFDAYKVLMVDKYGNSYGVVGSTGVKKGLSTSCCSPEAYHLTVSGSWPAGATHFMVVPFTQYTTISPPFMMPIGAMVAFSDVSTGSVTTVKSKVNLNFGTKASATAYAYDERSKGITANGIAAGTEGVEPENVIVTKLSLVVGTSRRLFEDSSFRRLATYKVVADFTIYVADTYTGPDLTAASVDAAKLIASVNQQATAQGMSVTVASATVDAVVTEVVAGGTDGPDGTETTGGADSAAISILALVVGFFAVAGLQ